MESLSKDLSDFLYIPTECSLYYFLIKIGSIYISLYHIGLLFGFLLHIRIEIKVSIYRKAPQFLVYYDKNRWKTALGKGVSYLEKFVDSNVLAVDYPC